MWTSKKPYFYKGNTLSKRLRGQVPRAQIQVCVSTKQSSWPRGGAICDFWPFLLLPHFSSEMPIFIVRKGAVPEPAFRWTPNRPVFWRNAVPLATVRHAYICCRQGIWSPGGPFFAKKMLLAAEPSILSKGILPNKRRTKFKVFGDQIPWLVGPNSLTYFFRFNTHPSTFVSMPRNPYFCSVFLKFCVLHEDSSKMARNACQKECYYLVKCARGWFLCWDQIPLRAIFAFSPVGLLKPFFSPETSIFIAFSRFSEIGNFWPARPPPHYFLPHFTVSPFKDPKKCPKNSPTRGANSTLFFDPYFRSVFRPFLAQKCETAIHPYISSTALQPPNHYISSVFLSMHQKRRRQTATRGDQIPFLYLPR